MYTHLHVCPTYITVLKPRLYGLHTLFHRHYSEYPVSFALEFAKKRLQSLDKKNKISDKVLIQSR